MKTDDTWKYIKLDNRDLFAIKYGKSKPKEEGNIPVFGSSGVYSYTKEPLVGAPVIIIGRKGNAGSIQLINEPCWASDTTFYLKLLKPNMDYKFLSEYLTYRSPSNSKTQTTLPSLSSDDLYNIPVPVPPLVEQRGIAEVLGTVDEAIRLTDQVIERTETLKRGLMQRLLTQGIGHTEFKDTLLGKIPETWKTEKIGNSIILIKSGISRQFTTEDTGYPVLRSTNIQNDVLTLNDIKYWYKKDPQGANLKNLILDDSDILVNFINSIDQIGKTCLFKKHDREYIYTTNIFRIKLDENKILHKYFHYFTHTWMYREQILRITKAAVQQASITQKDFNNIKIIVPSIEEQIKIINIIDSIINNIRFYHSLNNSFKLLKAGLMQILLSGKVRVELKEDGLHRVGDYRKANN